MRPTTPPSLRAAFLALLYCLAAWGQATDLTPTEADLRAADCRRIAQLTVHDYSILSAEFVDATDRTPARCRVLGVLPPEIVFHVVLPVVWNGRILMTGNGGYGGTPPNAPGRLRQADRIASEGFVAVNTNTGHDRRAEPLASFALNNRQKEIDFGFRAVHLTIQTAKELTALYYGREADYSYWESCSTGGGQGVMEV